MAITMDKLAEMVQKGFLGVNGKIDNIQSNVEHLKFDSAFLKSETRNLAARIERIEQAISQINTHIANIDYEDLVGRVKYLEIKLGIESGK